MLPTVVDPVQRNFLLSCFFDLQFQIFPLHKFRPNLSGSAFRCDCRQGWQCSTPGKHPKIRWTDPSQYPDAGGIELYLREGFTGWGVHLGLSQVVAVDLDPKNGGIETIKHFFRQWGDFPPTFTTTTGSGGAHWYFCAAGQIDPIKGWIGPEGVTSTSVPIGPGVDSFSGQHFLVLPYSPHKSGRWYRHNGLMFIAPMEEYRHG